MNKKIILFITLFLFHLHSANAEDNIGIASAHPLATQAGIHILKQGGNAFDAAIAISSVLAVVEPYSSGLGGGGFWLLHDVKNNQDVMLDGRETAPEKATKTMYLDKDGKVLKKLSIDGALAAAIPGEPAALDWLATNKGRLPLAKSLQAAITIAEKGFKVDAFYQKMVRFRLNVLRRFKPSAAVFLIDNEIPKIDTLIKQPHLAKTLKHLAKYGRSGFYQGMVANKMVAAVNKAGGIWTLDDLKNYQVKLREPITIAYQEMIITSAALPSSGGIALAEMFNILANYPLEKLTQVDRIHLITEAMRRAYRDRAEYMGDSDFITIPTEELTSKGYAKGLSQSIRFDRATKSTDLAPTVEYQSFGTDTTHFSVIDKQGNRVAATLSINYPFGSGFVVEGTGILLNDEMDDFSAKPNTPNIYGLVGGTANAIEPNKRMLSSMSPTFLETEGQIAMMGSPGGSRIISMVLLGALAFYENKTAAEIVNLPRFHHQYLPDQIEYEKNSFDTETIKQLKQRGHRLKAHKSTWGNMQIVIKNKTTDKITAASDQRGIGQAITD